MTLKEWAEKLKALPDSRLAAMGLLLAKAKALEATPEKGGVA
jgi:hypothetical protein